jgi:hypothetical protein
VQDMIAFRKEMANPSFINKVTELGFEWIELRSESQSATFPDGILDIPVSSLANVQ